jgi:hypothetical protein
MENEVLLPIQKLCRYLEEHEPRLFDVYSTNGKDFIAFAAICMKEEKEALKEAFMDGCNKATFAISPIEYMKDKYQL